jgi:CubicO group peptidase (beta-lactamase class C family)
MRCTSRTHPDTARFVRAVLLAVVASGCTTYRIVRYREPDARNQTMFPARLVRKADRPFEFARAANLRNDMDTVTVRWPDARRMLFRQYMADHAVLAFVVIRNDTIIYETYRDGFTDSTIHNSFSTAKSILSALVGIAIGEGKIKSLDDPVTNYVTELADRPAFAGVTLRHLLDMKSGLRQTKTGNGWYSDFRSDEARIYYTSNLYETIRDAKREMEPGTRWIYKDIDAELLGWVLSRAVGTTVAAYTEAKLWKRIGTEHNATWSLDHGNGQEKTSSGFNATARDYARFGRLFLNGGSWNGEQLVPAQWALRSAAVDSSRTEPEISNWWQMQHSMYWWHPLQPRQGDFYADGSHGQRIYVDPASRMVIVQLANLSRQDFPFRKLVAYLNGTRWEFPRSIPALVRQAAMTHGADSVRPVLNRLLAERQRDPGAFVMTQIAMNTVGTLLSDDEKTRPAGIELLRAIVELYPKSADGFVRLSDALLKAGDREGSAAARQKADSLGLTTPKQPNR